jgi:hypothetical protein
VAAARARVLALFEDAEQLRHDAHCAPAPFTPAARAPTPTPTPAPTPLPDDAADDAGSDMGYHDVGERCQFLHAAVPLSKMSNKL